MVPFNRPPYIGKEMEYISKAIRAHKICGDGQFTKKMPPIAGADDGKPEGAPDYLWQPRTGDGCSSFVIWSPGMR